MISKILLLSLLFLFSSHVDPGELAGHWVGILKIKSKTYKLYLQYEAPAYRLAILNPKANDVPIDTMHFTNDSLYFNRDDFYTEYKGKYKSESKTIHGYWTDDGHKRHPLTFLPVNPDTVVGLEPRINRSLTWKNPPEKNDGITTCNISTINMHEPQLDSLSLAIMNERFPNIHSVLISKDNCLIYEDYFYGWTDEDIWLIQSVTKSFTSALMGIALSKGEIKSLNESICGYFKRYKSACTAQTREITIQHLLTMTTGLEWNELEFDYYDERNTANQCGKVPDPFECVLSRNKIADGGQRFSYNSMNHLMVNMVLKKSKSVDNAKELRQRLLTPLGIHNANLGRESFGVIGDIGLSPRHMLKFGMLFLNEGKWNGKQIIPSAWVKESTSAKVDLGADEGYGYFWWTKQFNVNDNIVNCYYAWGYGGQYIFVIPDYNIVVTMTASNWIMDEKKYAFEMMERYILPSIIG